MNLVIGSSSQLAHYFPSDYVKVSSRNPDLDELKHQQWEAVYLTFAEQRIYDANIDYITPNYLNTLRVIEALLEVADKIVCYTSCELWNELSGTIGLDTPAKFSPLHNEYAISKLLLWQKVLELRKTNGSYNKVIFLHPFYFNSVHRSSYFLFGKIFDSILHHRKIQVGNLDFYRDMVHPKFVVQKSIELQQDAMMGSGHLFNVRTFVQDLYTLNGMGFTDFVEEDRKQPITKEKLIRVQVDWNYSYQDLLTDTQRDIEEARRWTQ